MHSIIAAVVATVVAMATEVVTAAATEVAMAVDMGVAVVDDDPQTTVAAVDRRTMADDEALRTTEEGAARLPRTDAALGPEVATGGDRSWHHVPLQALTPRPRGCVRHFQRCKAFMEVMMSTQLRRTVMPR
mmetsp:Transcript_28937/g.55415  ORF Transcript_28937/g.55415 Transcript_28937/m.55415 type:complete len:131 (+) Transcript_28937:1924-2316(+)